MANRWGSSGNSGWLCFGGLLNHCRWWLKPWNKKTLAPWKESYDQPRQHIQKQRHHFANKGPSSQGYGFSSGNVWIWELDYKESWAWKNWCIWTVVLEISSRISNQSILKEISPGCSWKDWCWSWNSNTLATQWEELTYLKIPWCWERLRAGGEGDDRGWGGLDGITDSMDMGLGGLRELVMNRKAWCAAIHGVTKSRTWLSNWTKLNCQEKKDWPFFHLSFNKVISDLVIISIIKVAKIYFF